MTRGQVGFIGLLLCTLLALNSCSSDSGSKRSKKSLAKEALSDSINAHRQGMRIIHRYFSKFDFSDTSSSNQVSFDAQFSNYAKFIKGQPLQIACASAHFLVDCADDAPLLQTVIVDDFRKYFFTKNISESDSMIYNCAVYATDDVHLDKIAHTLSKSKPNLKKADEKVVVYKGSIRLK